MIDDYWGQRPRFLVMSTYLDPIKDPQNGALKMTPIATLEKLGDDWEIPSFGCFSDLPSVVSVRDSLQDLLSHAALNPLFPFSGHEPLHSFKACSSHE